MIVSYKALSEFNKTLKYFLSNYKRRTYVTFIGTLCLSGLELINAAMILPLISLGIDSDLNNPLILYTQEFFSYVDIDYKFDVVFVIFIVAYSARIILELLIGIFIDYSSVLIARDFRVKVINGLKAVSWGYLTKKPHGMFVNLMTQEIERAAGLFNTLQVVTVSMFSFIVYLILGFTVAIKLLIAAVVMGCISIFIARPMFEMARRSGAGQIESMRNISADLLQGIRALKVFKAMSRERELLATISSGNDSLVEANLLKVRAQRFLGASQQILFVIFMYFGLYFARDFLGIDLVEIGFMGIVLLKLNTHFTNLLKKFHAITSSHYALDKIDEFLNEIVLNKEHDRGKKAPSFPNEIKFQDVVFSYDKRTILNKVSFSIPLKGLTTIVGSSGAGKTTIIDLICGFYKANEGHIYIGEDDINELELRKLRQSIGYVTQDSYLLHQSIAKNVAAFDENISDEDIENALKASGVWDTVVKLNDGVNTNAGESGAKLSGGERQRVAIARALAKKPKLLILDEPTSALDSEIEKEIMKTIINISKDIQVVVISHQKIFEESADVLYRLENGKIHAS